MDVIYNSVKNVNCNDIWITLFHKIKNLALNMYIWIVNKKFNDLEFRYTATKNVVSDINDERIIFMGLKQNFTKDELDRSFRRLAKLYHPDKNGDKEKFQKLMSYKSQLEGLLYR